MFATPATVALAALVAAMPLDSPDDRRGECDPPCPPGAILEGEACGVAINHGCDGAPPGGSDCCVPHITIGCDSAQCVNLVCEIDEFCCQVAWDQICVDEVLKKCPELCNGQFLQMWSPIAIGQTICGSVSTNDGGLDDIDWYELQLDAVTELIVSLVGGPAMQLAIVDDDGVPDCVYATELNPTTVTAPCGTASVTACLEAGTHWVVVRPLATTGLACDAPGTHYVLSVAASATQCTLPDPVNDACDHAIPLEFGTTWVSTHNAGTEIEGDGPLCHGIDLPTYRDVWFTLTAPRTGRVRISACGTTDFSARLVAYTGNCAALEVAACEDAELYCAWEDPQIDVEVVEGSTYLVRFGGSYDVEGTAALTVSYLPCSAAYDLTLLDDDYTVTSTAAAVSEDGEIVGTWTFGGPLNYGFRWTERAGFHAVSPGVPGALFDVNDAGVAVGWSKPASAMFPASATAFALTSLPGLGTCTNGIAYGVNDAGVIVGYLTGTGCPSTPVRWSRGVPATLDVPPETDRALDINVRGSILGDGVLPTPFGDRLHGWVLIDGRFQWLPSPIPGFDLQVHSINGADEVAADVILDESPLTTLGVLWKDGVFTTVDPPGAFTTSTAADVSDSGIVIGDLYAPGFWYHRSPYIRKGTQFVELNSRLDSRAGGLLKTARAINEAGVIVGAAGLSQSRPARLKPVPPTGDLDCNAIVDASDLAEVLGAWGPCAANTACPADFNVDGMIDAADLAVVLGAWGPVPVR